METDGPDELTSLDWRTVAAELLEWAILRAGKYRWSFRTSLPDGSSLEDIVYEVIQEIIEEPERLQGVPPMVKMRRMIDTKLWNLAKSADDNLQRLESMDAQASFDRGLDRLIRDDERARALQLLMDHPKVKESEELQLVVLARYEGHDKAAEIAQSTNLMVKTVYDCNKELSKIYPAIAQALRPERGQS